MGFFVGQMCLKRLGQPPQVVVYHIRFNGSEVRKRRVELVDQCGNFVMLSVETVNHEYFQARLPQGGKHLVISDFFLLYAAQPPV